VDRDRPLAWAGLDFFVFLHLISLFLKPALGAFIELT